MKLKINNRIIMIMLFFAFFMILQRINNIYILFTYFILGEVTLYFYLLSTKKIEKNAIKMFLIMLFFWFQEFTSAQEDKRLRYIVYGLEIILIVYLFLYSLIHNPKINRNQFKITSIILCVLLFIDFIGIIFTYDDFVIFLYSAYDSCKYFTLIYYVLAIRMSKKDFEGLLELLMGVVLMHTICSILQFSGNQTFFDFFRGRYKIVRRMGSYRAIGMFPYAIELGNYSCVLFALYYNYSKLVKKEKKLVYSFIEICLIICIIFSGTRTAMINVIFIFILANISSVKKWFKTIIIILTAIIIGSNFINIEEIINRTKWDVSIELPRTYYFRKGIEVWKDHALFGIGYNTYGSAKYRERTDDIIFNTYNIHKFDYANLATTDSFAVEIIPEFGIIGILTILLYGMIIYKYYSKKIMNRQYYKIFIIVILSISIMSINSSTAFINPHIGTWFWIACGLLISSETEEKMNSLNSSKKLD